MASDASHYYENFTNCWPFPIVFDVGAMVEGYALLANLSDGSDHIIPGHDPLVLSLYPPAAGDPNTVRLDVSPKARGAS